MDMKYEINRKIEAFKRWFVEKLPAWIIYYSAIRLLAFATTGKYQKTDTGKITAVEALKRWEGK
jgi:hypothetical protein